MDQQTQSPLPNKQEEYIFDFFVAMRLLMNGKKVTRKDWANDAIWGQLVDDTLMLRKEDGKYYQWIITKGDLEGTDWIVIQ